MSRATTKAELIKASDEQFTKMWKLIDSLTPAKQAALFHFDELVASKKEAHWKRDKNLRDVLIHLYEWHQLLLKWVQSNKSGDGQPFLPEPYNWKTYGDMNVKFWEKHQATGCEKAKSMLHNSHKQVMELIATFTNEELFLKKHFAWTDTSTLGAYCVSTTASHYDWAIKKIQLHLKTCR
ncbi:MAG: ClbS/DfsB family four-helix bundle protein [Kineosporiaceae bacterium]|nr:ClbS/DfsB family four-helix bundle protein [Kineosporiaceae bacterium]